MVVAKQRMVLNNGGAGRSAAECYEDFPYCILHVFENGLTLKLQYRSDLLPPNLFFPVEPIIWDCCWRLKNPVSASVPWLQSDSLGATRKNAAERVDVRPAL